MVALLSSPQTCSATLDTLISFASDDPQMEAGCLFVKMRATRSPCGAPWWICGCYRTCSWSFAPLRRLLPWPVSAV
ncbi:hypothetical protein [Synechococcus sp. MW101C3]|uniref:hypothetical protein n=1 Tax=Synechococcus sp. MW101C3 TaxID=210768 RepID=UPI0011817B0D|nr:hypothetical protein [Synechococcus sp. MW101C3]